MDGSVIIGVISLSLTILGMVGGGVWIAATIKVTVGQLVKTVESLTGSVDRLTERIDDLEHDHADTRERIAKLEGSSPQ